MLTRIGKYEVQSEIGHGGFGRVYRAHDPSVDRKVAIKILSSRVDPDMIGQFRAEAKTTGNLRHKNIVTVYDFGEHDGVPFLVMELLEGQNLLDAVQSGKELSLLEKLQVLSQTAEGLHHAHQMGVIHRDVKPANIMLVGNGSVKIMDFGISQLVSLSSTRQVGRTDLTGTTRYMAPEQFSGTPADVQTDVFAFGVVCYECISGVPPFQNDGDSRIMYRLATPAAQPLDQICSDCPPALAQTINRTLAFDRDVRYQSLEDVLLDLQPILLQVRRKHALSIMPEVDRLVGAGEHEKAVSALKLVLDLDPSHEAARSMLERLWADQRIMNLRRRTQGFLSQAAERLLQRDYSGAIEKYELALRADNACEDAHAGLSQARKLLENSRLCARLLSNAKQAAGSGNSSEAFHLIQQALDIDPAYDQALNYRRELTVSVAIARAREMAASKEFRGALALLNELQELSHYQAALQQLNEISLAWIQFERLAGNWNSALEIVEHVREQFPEQEDRLGELALEIREDQAASQRARTIQDATIEADKWLAENSFSLAIEALDGALAQYPKERKLLQFKQRILAEQLENQLRESIRLGTSLVNEAKVSGDWEAALDNLSRACNMYPKAEELSSLRTTVEGEIAERESLLEWRELQGKVAQLLAFSPAEAVSVLVGAAPKHEGRAEFPTLLETARGESDYLERLGTIGRHIRQKSWRHAGAALEAAAVLYPDRTALDDLANEIIEQRELEQATELRATIRQCIQSGNVKRAREMLTRLNAFAQFKVERDALDSEVARLEAAPQLQSCPACGTKTPILAKFCDNCGMRFGQVKVS